MCVRCGTGTIAWCTDPTMHGDDIREPLDLIASVRAVTDNHNLTADEALRRIRILVQRADSKNLSGDGRKMYRYEMGTGGRHAFTLSGDPVAVAAKTPDLIEFWAENNGSSQRPARIYQVFGTGDPLPEGARWIGTCARVSGLASGLVWHLYELAR